MSGRMSPEDILSFAQEREQYFILWGQIRIYGENVAFYGEYLHTKLPAFLGFERRPDDNEEAIAFYDWIKEIGVEKPNTLIHMRKLEQNDISDLEPGKSHVLLKIFVYHRNSSGAEMKEVEAVIRDIFD